MTNKNDRFGFELTEDMIEEPMQKASIIKLEDDQHLVYGWASVIEDGGKTVVDHQDDVITEKDLQAAAHKFMLDYRASKAMHEGGNIGEVVESVFFSKQLQDALGIDLKKIGWFICVKVNDEATWQRVKSGELKAFSIGGSGERKKI